MSKTTLDLSTLSDIADGSHTVKVKAKANGYIDSEFSNGVSWTKAPSVYNGRFINSSSSNQNVNVLNDDGSASVAYLTPGDSKTVSGNKFRLRASRLDVTMTALTNKVAYEDISPGIAEVTATDDDFYVVITVNTTG